MKKTFMASLLLAALATSCSEDLNVGNNIHTETLTASVTAEQTRAAFTSNGKFYWSSGDQIGVTTTTSDKMFSPMTLTDGAGEASATFKGDLAGSIGKYAIYPYSEAHGLDGTTLTYSFPATYDLKKVDQTYFPEKKDGNSYNPAMWAYIQDKSVTFKHLGGVFMIKIAKMPCASGTLEFTSTQNMCGKYAVNLGASEPQLVNTTGATGAGSTVTITFEKATEGQPGVFYVPVPTGDYDARLTLKDGNNNVKLNGVVAGSFNIARRDLQALTIGEQTIDAGVATTAATAADVTTALASSNNVALTAEVSGTDNTVTIPEATSTTSGSETQAAKTLSFSNVAAGASIKIADANTSTATAEAAKSVKELTVTIPNVKTTDYESAPSLEVAMPNSTVTVGGNAGVATINELTASTAENTLIVSSGVTINKLIVKKGNVRINKGATVSAIELNGATAATVYYEEGANVATTAAGVTFIKIPVGTQVSQIITTQAQLKEALTTGGNYVLGNDVTDANAYSISKVVSIDLNQHKLTATGLVVAIANGSLTLKNGEIEQQGDKGRIAVDTDGKLYVDRVTYKTTVANSYNCVFVVENAQNATLSVTNSYIKGGYYAVSTNASTNPVANGSITLENDTLIATETGLLINIPAYVTIKNCICEGNHQGALLRGGIYKEISGCTFTLKNATVEAGTGENNWGKNWNIGNQTAFAALVMGNYGSTSYNYVTTATFTGTNTAIVDCSGSYTYPAIHVCSYNSKAVTITGFNGHMTTKNEKGGKETLIEYGTDNITVDGVAKTNNTGAYK